MEGHAPWCPEPQMGTSTSIANKKLPKRPPELRSWKYSGRIRVAVAAVCGLAIGFATAGGVSKALAPLWGWDTAAAIYIVWLLATVFRLDSESTAEMATAEDPDSFTADIMMVLASIVSLGAVGLGLVESGQVHQAAKTALIITCVASIILSWALAHMAFTLRYARLFYADPKGGVNFYNDQDPSYMDFAYLSFTIGMTFQVSDTDISKPKIRATILRHALLSYLFGTVILATTINFVAGLSK